MITFKNLTLQRDNKILFDDTSTSFYNKQKIGVVGKNGSGKTSLFLLLLGKLFPNDGEINLAPPELTIATVEQEIPQTDRPAVEYVIDADIRLSKCLQDLQKYSSENNAQKLSEIYALLADIDGFTARARAAKILNGLGFAEQDILKPVNEFSGGWRMRLNIAQALFVPSDLLLLDEPTNHLDLDTVIWLEKWLLKYPGLLLLISHDREFLDHVTTQIAHIENTKITLYAGNYSSFEKQRIAALTLQEKHYAKQQKQIEHLEAYIRRFRYKATKARQAQSRIKALNRMQEILPAHFDSPFSFEFKEPKDLANPLITLEQLTFTYAEELDTDNAVLEEVNFQLNTEDRIGLLGRNGAGKSTLIKLLAGSLTPFSGSVIRNAKLQIGYFAQHVLDLLDRENNALQELAKIAPDATELKLRKFLGGFDFSGDMVLMPVKNFSGGEKSRLALALLVWQAPSVLLLDEPTNHLDIDMRQALILALQNYQGAVVIVSHDRFLLEQIVDQYYLIAEKQVKPFSAGLAGYQAWLAKNNASLSKPVTPKTTVVIDTKKPDNYKQAKHKQKQLKQLEKQLVLLVDELKEIDSKLAELSSDADNNFVEITHLTEKRTAIDKQIRHNEDEWLELSVNVEAPR